jgi:hypothetical protein
VINTITLRFFEKGKQIAAFDTELKPEILATCSIKGKTYDVYGVQFVFENNGSYLRLDVSKQPEKED